MEDKCPKCGETLLTKTIQKKIGSGSIDYPIAQTCPKCKWSKDLTGAGDIAAKPVMADAGTARKEEAKKEIKTENTTDNKTDLKTKVQTVAPAKPVPPSGGINTLIPIVLAILVLGAIAWVFFINPAQKEQVVPTPTPTPRPVSTPVVTQTPVRTIASTPAPVVTASGNHSSVKLDTQRGFTPKTVTIKPGDSIVWTNEGTYTVTLVSSEGLFEDKLLNNAKRMDYTFLKTGTFNFYLKDEKSLTGTIVVEP
ncbi:MAG: cupredoxin domain-containing protein [Candidatus Methanoperedens sp.]|nr:cupredoxin domain-containing protein [Candidatus Methanoperedens sp.]